MTRTTGRLTLALAALLLLATACAGRVGAGDGGRPGSSKTPGAPGELVLRVDTEGGFIGPNVTLTRLPGFSLYADGSLIVPGPQIEIYPGPALPNLLVTNVSAEGVQRIVEAARAAGLARDGDHGLPGVADATTTVFTLVEGRERHVTKVYALEEGRGTGGLSQDEQRARAALQELRDRLGNLGAWLPAGSVGSERAYSFDELRIYAFPGAPPGGSEDLKQNEVEWPLQGSLAAFGQPLPTLAGARCGTVTGEDLNVLLPRVRTANALTPWRSGGELWHLALRPLLPDETGCPAA